MTTQMKATEQYFHMVWVIKLYKVVLTFEPVDEILKSDHSNDRDCHCSFVNSVNTCIYKTS